MEVSAYTRPMKRTALVLSLLLLVTGCAKKVAVHPGAISNLDSYSYDILIVEQEVLTTARAQFTAGTLPPSAKPFLKNAITQYNVAESAWHAYHSEHSANATALQDAINALVAAVSQLQQQLGKTPAAVPQAFLKGWSPAWA